MTYRDAFAIYKVSPDAIKDLYDSILEDGSTALNGYSFLLRNKDYVEFSYFTKYTDWKNENEYRYLIGSDNEKLKEANGLDYLEGVVVGKKIDQVHEWQIKTLI